MPYYTLVRLTECPIYSPVRLKSVTLTYSKVPAYLIPLLHRGKTSLAAPQWGKISFKLIKQHPSLCKLLFVPVTTVSQIAVVTPVSSAESISLEPLLGPAFLLSVLMG